MARPRKFRVLAAGGALTLAAGITALAVNVAAANPRHGGDHHRPGNGIVGNVSANLFEWNWPSVANECTNVLGPDGYASVQVSPPADSLSRDQLGNGSDAVLHPWWEVYQPVHYNLTSRFGNEQQFKDMVTTCRAAGVKVIVDAVINHMTGQGHKSYGGVEYTHFSYPDYGYDNFHHLGTGPNDCDSADGGIDDFNDYHQLIRCELVGLADLRTEDPATRAKIAAYLNKLIGYGVSGFRVDAAKHIGQVDLLAIERLLHRTADGTGNITGLRVWGEAAGLIPSDKSLVFVENHDTERGGNPATLSYKDGATNTIASDFLLAYGYGTPQVYSGFAFGSDTNQSPPSDAKGTSRTPTATTAGCASTATRASSAWSAGTTTWAMPRSATGTTTAPT